MIDMPKKCILIVLDGLGDRAIPALGYRTPLQTARTPVLDRFAREGANGLYHASFPGQALPSENAHFAMFGYAPKDFPGRGALEAIGSGIRLSADKEVAILGHLACVKETGGILILEDGKPEPDHGVAEELIAAITPFRFENLEFEFHQTHGIHGILVIKDNASPFITDSDPIESGRPLISVKPWREYNADTAAALTARAMTAYLRHIHRRLLHHPLNTSRTRRNRPAINAVVTQRAGRLKPVPTFTERYGIRGLSIASGLVYHGLGAYLGIDCIKSKDTGNPGNDLADRISTALASLSNYDLIHVHTKTPDEAAHTKDPLFKKAVIESLDRGIGKVAETLMRDPDLLVVITADHSTPSQGPLIHSGEPVPLVMWGSGVRRDSIHEFSEVSCAGGALGMLRGVELIHMILNHLDRIKLHGLRDTPDDQPYWPGNYEPFQIQ